MKIVKTCRIHGDLTKAEVIKHSVKNDNRYKDDYILRCIKCVNVRNWASYVKDCHIHGNLKAEDVKTNGRCKLCHRASANTQRNNNREWFNAKMAVDRAKNPEKWDRFYKGQYARKVKKFGKESLNTKEIIRVHGLTQDRYDQMFKDQDGKCKICNEFETRRKPNSEIKMRLVVDHCHKTKIVRGLLCHLCNTALGKFKDNKDLLHSAIIYLEEFEDDK